MICGKSKFFLARFYFSFLAYHSHKTLACSKRSDSGEPCEVKKAMKSRGGLGSHLSSSLAFIFWRSFLLRTAPHYLNAWNRLTKPPGGNLVVGERPATKYIQMN